MKFFMTLALLLVSATSFAKTDLVCFGTEPFFSAGITGDSLGFGLIGEGDLVEPILSKINARGTNEFAFKVKSQNLSATIITGDCNDGMSDRVYNYHILLEKGNEAFYGCCNKPSAYKW